MGLVDCRDWVRKKVKDCECCYCRANFFSSSEQDLDPRDHFGAVPNGNTLPDGVVQFYTRDQYSGKVTKLWHGKPECQAVQPIPGAWTPKVVGVVTGYNCKRCNNRNDYAEPNQKDGTYVCYNCR